MRKRFLPLSFSFFLSLSPRLQHSLRGFNILSEASTFSPAFLFLLLSSLPHRTRASSVSNDVSAESMRRVRALNDGRELWIAHTGLPSCGADTTRANADLKTEESAERRKGRREREKEKESNIWRETGYDIKMGREKE